MTDAKLKPCPFCGSDQIEHIDWYHNVRMRCVLCDTLGTSCERLDQAIAAWNRRATDSDTPAPETPDTDG